MNRKVQGEYRKKEVRMQRALDRIEQKKNIYIYWPAVQTSMHYAIVDDKARAEAANSNKQERKININNTHRV